MKVYKVFAANFHGTYTVGTYCGYKDEVIEQARKEWCRQWKDGDSFRFWVVEARCECDE